MKKNICTTLKVLSFFALWIVGIIICSLPAFDKPLFLADNPVNLRLWWELTPLILTLIINFIFVRILEKGKIKISIFGNTLKDSILGFKLGCIWIGIATLILTSIGSFHLVSKNTITYTWIWVLAALLNVIMQEYLVRGYLFQMIKEEYNILIAVVITTAIFTAMHGPAFEAGIISVLNVITTSVFLSLLLIYTKNLLAPIITHFIWNSVGCILLGGVSLASDYPSIWKSNFSGNILITGGSAKMEGSIVVLAINFVLIIIFTNLIAKQYKAMNVKN